MAVTPRVPVLGFAAFSGTGKTTLLCRIVPILGAHGLRLGLLKHTHHGFEVDRPGKDSHRLRQAGACQVIVASRRRWAAIRTDRRAPEPGLDELLDDLRSEALDLILVEGFKRSPLPKVELHRPVLGHPLLAALDPTVLAVITDDPILNTYDRPRLDINQPEEVARFILEWRQQFRDEEPRR